MQGGVRPYWKKRRYRPPRGKTSKSGKINAIRQVPYGIILRPGLAHEHAVLTHFLGHIASRACGLNERI